MYIVEPNWRIQENPPDRDFYYFRVSKSTDPNFSGSKIENVVCTFVKIEIGFILYRMSESLNESNYSTKGELTLGLVPPRLRGVSIEW